MVSKKGDLGWGKATHNNNGEEGGEVFFKVFFLFKQALWAKWLSQSKTKLTVGALKQDQNAQKVKKTACFN